MTKLLLKPPAVVSDESVLDSVDFAAACRTAGV
jgi:hypothetical protein